MSLARFNSIFGGLNSTAKKVYAVVPIAESWHITRITAEINRRATMDYRVITGCLESLRSAGLIREVARGEFQREAVRYPVEKTNPPHEDPMKNNTVTPAPAPALAPARVAEVVPAIDRLGALAKRMNELAQALKDLATDATDAAIDIEAELEAGRADVQRLEQVKALFKSLGMGMAA